MPTINLSELETAMLHYQQRVRDVVDYPDVSKTEIVIRRARQDLAKWFNDRGVVLDCTA